MKGLQFFVKKCEKRKLLKVNGKLLFFLRKIDISLFQIFNLIVICMYIGMYACLYVCMYTFTLSYVYVFMYVCICVCLYVCMFMDLLMHVQLYGMFVSRKN